MGRKGTTRSAHNQGTQYNAMLCRWQRDAFEGLLTRMEATWQNVAPIGNALLRSARSILASNQPSTEPCGLAPYYGQNECAPPPACRVSVR